MRIKADQLKFTLQHQDALAYLVSGDEPWLVENSCELIRKKYYQLGYQEKIRFQNESSSDWTRFANTLSHRSLMAEQTLIELQLTGNLNEAGSKIIQHYLKHPHTDKRLLITSSKLDTTQQRAAWVKAVDQTGIIIQIWPLNKTQFQAWLAARLQQAGLTVNQAALQLLSSYLAGNLLAAAQTIDKLALIYNQPAALSLEQIYPILTENSKFNINELLDVALTGDLAETSRIVEHFRCHATEPAILIWATIRELRTWIKIKQSLIDGLDLDQVLTTYKVVYTRKSLLRKLLLKIELEKLYHLFNQLLKLELANKGINNHQPLWHQLVAFYLQLCQLGIPQNPS